MIFIKSITVMAYTSKMSVNATNLGLMIAFLSVIDIATGYGIDDVKNLKKHLLDDSGYDKTIRPQINQSEPTNIDIALSFTSLLDFNLASGRISMSGYLYAFWYDQQLIWNPLHFNGITSFQVNRDLVWHPNIRNAFDLQNAFSVSHISIYAGGRVVWVPTNVFESVCIVDITYYPFDEHVCHFPVFPSSGSFIKFISMQPTLHMHVFLEHGEWEIVSTMTEVHEIQDPQYLMETSTFVSTMTVRRRPRFALLHTYFPLLLLYCMNILTCLVPLGQGERVSFSVTVLLALIFFTASATAQFPQSSLKTSYFSATIILAICASTLGVMFSVILVKLDATTTPVPRPLLRITKMSTTQRKIGSAFRRRNSVMTLRGSTPDIVIADEQDSADSKVKAEDTTRKPSDEATDTVMWSDISEKLNMIVLWVYSFLLVLSAVVLISLHHYR